MSQNKKRVPKLRFPEFSGEWEKDKLGDIVEVNPANDFIPIEFIYIDLDSVSQRTLTAQKVIRRIEAPSRAQRLVEYNDVMFQMVRPYQKNNILINFSLSKPIVASTGYAILRGSKCQEFIYHTINTSRFNKDVLERCTGTSYPAINSSDLREIVVHLPEMREQIKIADFFTLLDDKIQTQEQIIENLEQLKRGYMQKIFSQQLRFKDENGEDFPEWEEKSLSELCKITTGKLNANAMVENGKYRFYTCAKEFYFIDEYAFDDEALLVSGNGANVGYIHYFKGKFNAYQRTYVLSSFIEEIKYVKSFMDLYLKDRIANEKKAGNTPYIVLDTLSDMAILLPCKAEQRKIFRFLELLDEKYQLELKKLAKLNELKSGYLQQMFI